MNKLFIVIPFFFLFTCFLFCDQENMVIDNFKPIDGIHGKIARRNPNTRLAEVISGVPSYNWSFGCSPTAAAMLIGYYDRHGYENAWTAPAPGYDGMAPLTNQQWNNDWGNASISDYNICPISASEEGVMGRLTRGHVDDYYVSYMTLGPDPYAVNGWDEHYYNCFGPCVA